jgi:hypothetical protein
MLSCTNNRVPAEHTWPELPQKVLTAVAMA